MSALASLDAGLRNGMQIPLSESARIVTARDGSDQQNDQRPLQGATVDEWNCLVVSAISESRESHARAVLGGGWSAARASRIDIAARMARQRRMRLAIIELSGASDDDSGLEELAGQITRGGGLVLVISSAADTAADEIRARQLGAWVFLAGHVPIMELASICRDAKRLLENRRDGTECQSKGVNSARSATLVPPQRVASFLVR